MRRAATSCAVLLLLAASCAVQDEKRQNYNPIVGGTQTIRLVGYKYEFVSTAPPFYQLPGRTASIVPAEGGKCTLRNDKGMWEAVLPGEVVVETGGDLRIDCIQAGFKPFHHKLSCTSPKARGAVGGAFAPLMLSPQLTAFGIVFAPAVVVGVMAAGAAVGSEASAAAAGPEGRDACDYGQTVAGVYLWPDDRMEEPW